MDGGIGDELRREREARGVDLEEVEAATGIRARFLAAIEEEDWDQLPGDFYARAFTRTYAEYLGLDPAEFALENRPDRVSDGDGPRVEPNLVPDQPSARKSRPWLSIGAALGGILAVAAIVAILVASLSGGGSAGSSSESAGGKQGSRKHHAQAPPKPSGASLMLTATGEVWVCLLDGSGRPLIDGEILEPGAEEGPFRSGRYTMAFGNGAVELMVDGAPRKTAENSGPVGYSIDNDGDLSEIPEGERPECT